MFGKILLANNIFFDVLRFLPVRFALFNFADFGKMNEPGPFRPARKAAFYFWPPSDPRKSALTCPGLPLDPR
jgi:hypothetical protein